MTRPENCQMNYPKHTLGLVNTIICAPKQLLHPQHSLRKSQEIKENKEPLAAGAAAMAALQEQRVLAAAASVPALTLQL